MFNYIFFAALCRIRTRTREHGDRDLSPRCRRHQKTRSRPLARTHTGGTLVFDNDTTMDLRLRYLYRRQHRKGKKHTRGAARPLSPFKQRPRSKKDDARATRGGQQNFSHPSRQCARSGLLVGAIQTPVFSHVIPVPPTTGSERGRVMEGGRLIGQARAYIVPIAPSV